MMKKHPLQKWSFVEQGLIMMNCVGLRSGIGRILSTMFKGSGVVNNSFYIPIVLILLLNAISLKYYG